MRVKWIYVVHIGWIQTLFLWILKVCVSEFRLYHQIRNKNESEIEKLTSRDRRIFEKKTILRYYALKLQFRKIVFS